MKKISLAIILAFSALACAQTTTTVTGTIKDLSNAVVTSGQVTFTLKPGADTTISGTARFSPSTVTCAINGSGLVKAADGLSVCTLVNNTALTPAGTYYQVCIQPQFVTPGSCFNWYALGTSTDITTVVPTPGTAPAFTFVDTYSNQTVAGNKTFTGTTTFSGSFGVGALTASSLGINALGTATSGANFNSGNAVWNASVWNGSIAIPDSYTCRNVAGTGANPATTFTCTHSGSSGLSTVSLGTSLKVAQDTDGCYTVGNPGAGTIQAAITLAGTTGCVKVPAYYIGTDTYTNPNGVPVIDYRPIGGVGAVMFGGNSYYLNSLVRTGPSLDGSGRLIPQGNDLFLDARGAADLILQQERTQTTATTSVGGAGTQNITVGATANFYLGAGITIERYGANEETIASGAWSITNGTTINATFAKAHTQPYAVDQWGALNIKGWLIRWFDQESGTQINQWKQLRSGANRGFALQDTAGTTLFQYTVGDGVITAGIPWSFAAGTKAAPGAVFTGDTGCGWYHRVNGFWTLGCGNVEIFTIGADRTALGNGMNLRFSPGDNSTTNPDTSLSRCGAACLEVGGNTTGDATGEIRTAKMSATYNAAGTVQTGVHIVQDTCTLGTSCGVTLSGSAAFTSSSSYHCTASDVTAANAVKVNQTAANAVTFTGTGTDVINYICVGN